jgi:hypothetical protein
VEQAPQHLCRRVIQAGCHELSTATARKRGAGAINNHDVLQFQASFLTRYGFVRSHARVQESEPGS